DDLCVEPVSVQVGKPQCRSGRSWLRTRVVVPLKPIVLHLVDALKHALLVLGKAWADAVPHALVLPLDEPVEAIVQLFHTWDEQLPPGWGLRRPQIGRTVGQVNMIVS